MGRPKHTHKVYVSFKRSDGEELAHVIGATLGAEYGVECFLDDEDLAFKDTTALESKISYAQWFIFVITDDFRTSIHLPAEQSICRQELAWAVQHLPLDRIIPVVHHRSRHLGPDEVDAIAVEIRPALQQFAMDQPHSVLKMGEFIEALASRVGATRLEGVGSDNMSDEVVDWLSRMRLARYRAKLALAGCCGVNDLVDMQEADLLKMGMSKMDAKRFMRHAPSAGTDAFDPSNPAVQAAMANMEEALKNWICGNGFARYASAMAESNVTKLEQLSGREEAELDAWGMSKEERMRFHATLSTETGSGRRGSKGKLPISKLMMEPHSVVNLRDKTLEDLSGDPLICDIDGVTFKNGALRIVGGVQIKAKNITFVNVDFTGTISPPESCPSFCATGTMEAHRAVVTVATSSCGLKMTDCAFYHNEGTTAVASIDSARADISGCDMLLDSKSFGGVAAEGGTLYMVRCAVSGGHSNVLVTNGGACELTDCRISNSSVLHGVHVTGTESTVRLVQCEVSGCENNCVYADKGGYVELHESVITGSRGFHNVSAMHTGTSVKMQGNAVKAGAKCNVYVGEGAHLSASSDVIHSSRGSHGLAVWGGEVRLTDCKLYGNERNNCYVKGGVAHLTSCELSGSRKFHGLSAEGGACQVRASKCTLKDNVNANACVCSGAFDVIFNDCLLSGATLRGGVYCVDTGSKAVLTGCNFFSNQSSNFLIENGGQCTVNGRLISSSQN